MPTGSRWSNKWLLKRILDYIKTIENRWDCHLIRFMIDKQQLSSSYMDGLARVVQLEYHAIVRLAQ